jgi:hypothetical protein
MDSQNRNEKKNSSSINDEVQKLLRKNGKITSSDFIRLKEKYGDDDLVDSIQNMYAEKYTNITKKAKKFAQLIREKYSNTQTPFHILLEKAIKYKIKYSLSDDEFAEFQRIYEQELVGNKSTDIIRPQTNLMKVLGGITFDYNGFKSKLNDDDYKYLQEILKLHATTKPLHAQVLLQSMQYTDCAIESLSGRYNRDLNRIGDHVHPVIAALFLPKFNIVDQFFLWSNIAGIVKSRYNNERLHSRPDYELFHALTTDPNDIVCDNRSPILDLLNRAQLQSQLWNSVLHLRNGQYYNASFKDFISSVDLCKLNKQDTPDLLYGRFDGVIIKRLLSAFSFRPTVVATTPLLLTSVSLNPYLLNNKPLVTAVPMINMRLPPKLLNNTTLMELKDAVEQTQFFLENGQIVPRSTSLIWSRGILIFYVDRRANTITYNEQLTRINMNILPASLSVSGGFERINKSKVIVTPLLQFNNEDYELRSVVISETNQNQNNNNTGNSDLIIGSSTLIRDPPDGITTYVPSYYYYDPYAPNKQNNDPITSINYVDPISELSFLTMAQEVGIVFIYANKSSAIDEKKDLVF